MTTRAPIVLINNESVTCLKKCLFWGIFQPIIGSGSSIPLSPARRFSTAEFAIPVLAAVVALQVRVVILLERGSGLEGIQSSKQFHRPANVWSEHNVRTTRKSMILAQGLRSHHIKTCSSNSSFLQDKACSRYQGCMMLTSRASTKASWSTSPPLEVLIMQVVGRILDNRLRETMPSVVGFRLAHLRSRRFKMRWTLITQQLTSKQHQRIKQQKHLHNHSGIQAHTTKNTFQQLNTNAEKQKKDPLLTQIKGRTLLRVRPTSHAGLPPSFDFDLISMILKMEFCELIYFENLLCLYRAFLF